MAYFQKTNIVIKLLRKPEIEYSKDGGLRKFALSSFWLKKYPAKVKEDGGFVNIVFFGDLADEISSKCDKGTNLSCDGFFSATTINCLNDKSNKTFRANTVSFVCKEARIVSDEEIEVIKDMKLDPAKSQKH